MSGERVERRLTAILAADIAGYSRLMGLDEAGTLARLRAHRRELIDPKIAERKGRIVKTTGDGILIEFPSVVEAVACAVAVQRGMAERNVSAPEDQRIVFRVGVNLGDIIVEGDDIHGDGVNVAARLEGIAEPGGICISGTVRDHIGDRLDLAFDDMGEQKLKNIARPLRVYRIRLAATESTKPVPAEGIPVLALPDKPSIAVLPFQNMSGDPEQEYFVDGMVEEIITALSRIRWLFVIARNSTFTYKGRVVDVKQVGRELGVRYVLEGSVRKGGNRVRITAQLIEAATGSHLWADRFDGSLDDVFELQDKVASNVAGIIEPTLQSSEIHRSTARSTADATTYDLYLRALSTMFSFSKEAISKALDFLDREITRDPDYGPALACAAVCRYHIDHNGWSDNPEQNRRFGIENARHALVVGEEDPGILVNAAIALAYFGDDIRATLGLIDRALALNPNFARAWYVGAGLWIWAGDHDAAIEWLENSLRFSPRTRVGGSFSILGAVHFSKRQFDEAAPKLLIAVQEHPTSPAALRLLAWIIHSGYEHAV